MYKNLLLFLQQGFNNNIVPLNQIFNSDVQLTLLHFKISVTLKEVPQFLVLLPRVLLIKGYKVNGAEPLY